MATRPGIRTLNNSGYNNVGRPTSPANYKGSGVRQISPALAGSQKRSQILATGRKGAFPQSVSPVTAGIAAGTVLTQGAQRLFEAGREGMNNLADTIRRLVPDNVPLVNIPSVNQPIIEQTGINAPIISNPVEFADAVVKTSQYSDDLVNEARFRAERGDVLSGLYAGTADTIVKGANDLYERVNDRNNQLSTPAAKTFSGIIKAGAGAVATIPAILQAGNYVVNPQRLVYNGDIPKTVSEVSVVGKPIISGYDTLKVSVEDVEAANSVLGTAASSFGELAKREIPRAVDAIKTEFRENPYGLTGQIIGGAVLAKGVGSALPKKVTPTKMNIEGKTGKEAEAKPTTKGNQKAPSRRDNPAQINADFTIKTARARADKIRQTVRGMSTPRNVGGYNVVFQNVDNTLQKAATIGGLGVTAAYVTDKLSTGKTETIPQRVVTVTFSANNDFIDDYTKDYPQKEDSDTKNKTPTGSTYSNDGGNLVIRPTNQGNTLKIEGGNVFAPEFTPNIDYVRVNELLNKDDVKSNNRNKNNNRFVAENVNNLRNQNRVRAEYAFEYSAPTSPRGKKRTKRRIDIDIDLSRKSKTQKKSTKKRYAKRQIVNPIPWLWDEVPSFSRKLPKTVELIEVSTLLT